MATAAVELALLLAGKAGVLVVTLGPEPTIFGSLECTIPYVGSDESGFTGAAIATTIACTGMSLPPPTATALSITMVSNDWGSPFPLLTTPATWQSNLELFGMTKCPSTTTSLNCFHGKLVADG